MTSSPNEKHVTTAGKATTTTQLSPALSASFKWSMIISNASYHAFLLIMLWIMTFMLVPYAFKFHFYLGYEMGSNGVELEYASPNHAFIHKLIQASMQHRDALAKVDSANVPRINFSLFATDAAFDWKLADLE